MPGAHEGELLAGLEIGMPGGMRSRLSRSAACSSRQVCSGSGLRRRQLVR